MSARRAVADRKTREARKEAGYVAVMCNVPPVLAVEMDDRRGDTPRGRWLVELALDAVGLPVEGLTRPAGRPRTRGLSLPVPLDRQSYRPVKLLEVVKRIEGSEVGEMDHVLARGDLGGGLIGLRWPQYRRFGKYDPYSTVKKTGSEWDYGLGVWPVESSTADRICRKCEESGARVVPLQLGWSGVVARCRPLVGRTDDEPSAWAIEIDIEASMSAPDRRPLMVCLRSAETWLPAARWFLAGDNDLGIVTSEGLTEAEMTAGVAVLRTKGARVRTKPFGISDRAVTATADVTGMKISIEADPADRRGLFLSQPINWGIGQEWTGQSEVSADNWPDLADRLVELGVTVEERQVEARRIQPIPWDDVPGWGQPAAGGNTLRVYQRSGVEFVLQHGLRALIGDEMGTGKTGQAITAAHAANCRRTVVVLPKNALGVWRRQLSEWCWPGHEPDVVVIRSALEAPVLPDGADRPAWVLVTYDMLTPRTEKFTFNGLSEHQRNQLSESLEDIGVKVSDQSDDQSSSLIITLDPAEPEVLDNLADGLPSSIAENDINRLLRVVTRVRGKLHGTLLDWHPDLVVIDEAHRIKNSLAKRTATVRTLIRNQNRGALLLTGTPLRNRAEEGLTLLEALLPMAEYRDMAKRHRMDRVELARRLFDAVMIRRTKAEVLSELPEKIRQEIEIPVDPIAEEEYLEAMVAAQKAYSKVLHLGGTRGQAAQEALPHWSRARRYLGMAKIADGGIADLVTEVVDERGACLLFAHHRDVIDTLQKQIEACGISVVRVDGRTSADDRTEAERAFQAGDVDVFLGGITAAGEALTLTRADTCVFAELPWVPAEMAQAEDRGHRLGQTAKAYQVVTFLADLGCGATRINMDAIMWSSLKSKSREIGAVLNVTDDTQEDQTVLDALNAASWQQFEKEMIAEGRAEDLESIMVEAIKSSTGIAEV